MPESSLDLNNERFPLRRPKLALAALRAALEEMAERIDSSERDLCDRALARLATLDAELEALEGNAHPAARQPSICCTLGEICQAAQQSLPSALRDRILIATQQSTESIQIDDAQLVISLRDLAESMFARGANAVLMNASLEGTKAVFALIDDRQGPAPTWADNEPLAIPDLTSMGGSVTPIGSTKNPQGVIVRVAVSIPSKTHRTAISTGGYA